MPKIGEANVRSAVLCEIIRQELNNKLMILGVYSGPVLVSSFPTTIGLAAYIEFIVDVPKRYKVDYRFSAPANNLSEVTAEVDVLEAGAVALPIPQLPLNLAEPGLLQVAIRIDNDEWTEVIKREIKLLVQTTQ